MVALIKLIFSVYNLDGLGLHSRIKGFIAVQSLLVILAIVAYPFGDHSLFRSINVFTEKNSILLSCIDDTSNRSRSYINIKTSTAKYKVKVSSSSFSCDRISPPEEKFHLKEFGGSAIEFMLNGNLIVGPREGRLRLILTFFSLFLVFSAINATFFFQREILKQPEDDT